MTAVVIKNVATRVVCANTLGVALGERGGATWRIQHTANAKQRLEEAGKAFRRLAESYTRFGELANLLAVTPFTDKQMFATVDRVMPVPKDDRDHDRLENERGKVIRLFDTAVGIERLRGTAWAALQGWTEYADHPAGARHRAGRPAPGPSRLDLDGARGGSEAGRARSPSLTRPGSGSPPRSRGACVARDRLPQLLRLHLRRARRNGGARAPTRAGAQQVAAQEVSSRSSGSSP